MRLTHLLTVLILAANARADGFRDTVAPVLEKRCVSCHNASDPKGKLDLTTRSAILKGGDSGPAVVPKNVEESVLLDMVAGDPAEMPKKGASLSKTDVLELRKWVEAGAPWPEGLVLADRKFDGESWWAFTPLNRPAVPTSKVKTLRNPVDAFILARLNAENVAPSPEASPRTLIRRLSFDLLGLPPTPEDVDAFVNDKSPDAYEKLVDRMLASPRYGERWGRHWLDVAHYGDTHGYDKDKRRDHAWPYRDWVIRAFNADLPYGRFVRRQIAGDVLFPDDPDGLIATGFIAAGPWDFVGHVELREGTIDKAKARLIDRDDMVASTISTFQSLTAHCARCHDHKFDPIPQKDYYRLQAVFAGVDRGNRFYTSDDQIDKRKALEARRAAIDQRLEAIAREVAAKKDPEQARLETEIATMQEQGIDAARPPAGAPSPTNGYHSAIHAKPETLAWVQVDLGSSLPINEIRIVPARPTDFRDTAGFGFPSAFKVEVSNDPNFPASQSKTVDSETRPDAPDVPDEPYVIRPKAPVSARYVRVTALRLWKRTGDYVFALAELEIISGRSNVALNQPVTALDSTESGRWSRKALVDGFDSRNKRPAEKAGALWHGLLHDRRDFKRARAEREEALITPALRAERDRLKTEREAIDAQIAALKSSEQVYAPIPHAPRPIHVLKRGEVEQPGELVGPGALSCVPVGGAIFADSEDEGARRVALADWLASPKNVLTWRSIANRVWSYHFGKGIVDTPNDFGRNGSKPSHPELLDYLAVALRDNGESIKALHKLILTSATYRQVSANRPEALKKDADNRLLWRQNRRRLEAEAVRDSVLAVTGTLDTTMYGPGFDLFRFKDDHSPTYDHTAPGVADNPRVRRRTVYRFTVRSVPNPFLECLDSADPNTNVPSRTTTITALQALALWNDRFIESQAEEFTRRLEAEGGDLESRVDLAYRLCLGRSANERERQALGGYAKKFGLAGFCRVLLNANEFMFVD